MMFLALVMVAAGERAFAPGAVPRAPLPARSAAAQAAPSLGQIVEMSAKGVHMPQQVTAAPAASPLPYILGAVGALCTSAALGMQLRQRYLLGNSAETEMGAPLARTPAPVMSMADDLEGGATTRREFFTQAAGALAGTGALLASTAANAEIDYAGVGFLGGAKTIDVNNANIRVYQKLPGMYPNAAGKIVSKAPYKSKDDMYAKAGFSSKEAEAVKKYDANFIFLEPRPEYIIDNINNGLYR
jgi:photosystem II PsbU protein